MITPENVEAIGFEFDLGENPIFERPHNIYSFQNNSNIKIEIYFFYKDGRIDKVIVMKVVLPIVNTQFNQKILNIKTMSELKTRLIEIYKFLNN